MTTPPNGWFRCVSLSGRKSLGFHCPKCRTVVYEVRGPRVFHCGAWEAAPLKAKILALLPSWKIQRPSNDQVVPLGENLTGILIGF